MNLQFAKRLFQKSDGLFRRKNYAAALILLDRLDSAFPDTRRIMYPRAMCLAEVGRTEEAIAICDRLIARHKYMRAADFKSHIEKCARVLSTWNAGGEAGPSPSELEQLHIGEGPSAFSAARTPVVARWRTRSARLVSAVVLLVIAAAVGGGYYLYSQQSGVASEAKTEGASAPLEASDLPPVESAASN